MDISLFSAVFVFCIIGNSKNSISPFGIYWVRAKMSIGAHGGGLARVKKPAVAPKCLSEAEQNQMRL